MAIEVGARVEIADGEGWFDRLTGTVVRKFPDEFDDGVGETEGGYGGVDYDWVVRLDEPHRGMQEVAFFEEDLLPLH